MQIKLVASKDHAASEEAKTFRYVFGKPKHKIGGAVYIDKTLPIPDEIVIVFRKGGEEDGGGDS